MRNKELIHGSKQAALIASGNPKRVQQCAQPFARKLFITLVTPLLMTSCASIQNRQNIQNGQNGMMGNTTPQAMTAPGDTGTQKTTGNTAENGQSGDRSPASDKNPQATAEYHFSMAQAYVAEGNPDRAIEEFKLTAMYDPKSTLVYTRLATEYVKKGMMSEAMEACNSALGIDPTFVDARLLLAGLYSAAHENDEALAQYDKVLSTQPKHEEAAVYRAQTLVDLDRVADATKSLNTFVKKNPDSTLAWFSLGRVEESQDHFKPAVIAYKKAIELRPSFNQPALSLAYLYEQKKMDAQAIAVYKDLYEETQDPTAANRLATVYLKQERYDLAVPYLESLAAADSEDMNTRVKLGLIQMEMKQYPKAIQTFQSILEKHPDSDRVHYYLGSLYEETHNIDQAMAELNAIPADSKLYSDSVLHVAYLTKTTKNVDAAKTYMNDIIKKSPRVANFYLYSASLQDESKDVPQAITTLEKAVAYFPEDEKVRYYLGSLYDRQGLVDKGLAQMEAILNVNSENVDAMNYIAYTWTVKGVRLDDAEKLLKHAMALRPNNGYIQDSWGWYLFTRGRVGEAVVQLEKAAQLKPNEATILEHLGDAYLRSNLREKALNQYAEAAKFADDEDFRHKVEMKRDTLHQEIVDGGNGHRDRMPANSDTTTTTK
jgi:tetratricopeptide (TPR) repeat protein